MLDHTYVMVDGKTFTNFVGNGDCFLKVDRNVKAEVGKRLILVNGGKRHRHNGEYLQMDYLVKKIYNGGWIELDNYSVPVIRKG